MFRLKKLIDPTLLYGSLNIIFMDGTMIKLRSAQYLSLHHPFHFHSKRLIPLDKQDKIIGVRELELHLCESQINGLNYCDPVMYIWDSESDHQFIIMKC